MNNGISIKNQNDILVLVNKQYYLPYDYAPYDLIEPEIEWVANINESWKLMRKEAAKALEALVNEASKQGIQLFGESAFRSYEEQKNIYEWVKEQKGQEYANKYCALPGCSEHQTGLCIDITNISYIDDEHDKILGQMDEGIWMKNNAHIYGFILRYPEEKSDITGYNYEPWHFRYVGIEAATEIYNNDLVLEQYLREI
jgi:LAS superfamily LD-carboxypeptidase LdcB